MQRCACNNGSVPANHDDAVELLKALANRWRLCIVEELTAGPRCVHELTERLGIAQPLVSQHLRVLRQADVVRNERRGKEVVYAIADEHISHIVADALRHVGEAGPPPPSGATRPPTGASRP
jgi:ArsR family transcriptional regulator, zinc-responsive transcriptional repressor